MNKFEQGENWYDVLMSKDWLTVVERIYLTHIRQEDLMEQLDGANDTEIWGEMTTVIETRQSLLYDALNTEL